jgi:hypothetical protein
VLGVFVTLAIMSLLFVLVSDGRRLEWTLCAIINTLAAGIWAQSPVDRPSRPPRSPKINSRGGKA